MAATRKPGRPRNPPPPHDRMPWETQALAKSVEEILSDLEVSSVDARVRLTFQKMLYRADQFGTDGRGDITLLIRTIIESEGNGAAALVEPIVSAVRSCMRPQWTSLGLTWIAAFDSIPLMAVLETVRDLFGEHDLWQNYCRALRIKISKSLQPAKPSKQAKVKQAPKPPLSVTRIPAIERAISLGKELLALRASIVCNKKFGREVRRRFPGVDQITASESMKVARAYGARPEIYRRLSWIALFELSSPKMSPSVRQAIEAEILAGKSVSATEIRRVRGRLKPGSPKRHPSDQPVRRMAA